MRSAPALVILLEVSPKRVSDGAAVTLRIAGGGAQHGYVYRGASDWIGRIANFPDISGKLPWSEDGWTGEAQAQGLDLSLALSEANEKTLLDYFWKNAPAALYVGPEGPPGSATDAGLVKIFDGRANDLVSNDRGRMTLQLSDATEEFNRTVLLEKFTGAGGIEGEADLKGVTRRRAFGQCGNVEARLLKKLTNVWVLTDPYIGLANIIRARDRGVEYSGNQYVIAWQGTTAATLAALEAQPLTINEAAFAPSIACLRLWTVPAKPLCCDVMGPGLGYNQTNRLEIARQLLITRTAITISAATAALQITINAQTSGLLVDDDTETIAQALWRLLAPQGEWWSLENGQLMIGRYDLAAAPVLNVPVFQSRRIAQYAPHKRRSLVFARNHKIHSDGEIATSLQVNFSEVAGLPAFLTDGRIPAGLGAGGTLIGNTQLAGGQSLELLDIYRSMQGVQLNPNPEFSQRTKYYQIYRYIASGTAGTVTLVGLFDDTAPNGSGRYMRVAYAGDGTADAQRGGCVIPIEKGSSAGLSVYAANTRLLLKVTARVPVGFLLQPTNNGIGAGGTLQALNSQAGTGAWADYFFLYKIGSSGAFGPLGYLFITTGAVSNGAASFDLARFDILDISSGNDTLVRPNGLTLIGSAGMVIEGNRCLRVKTGSSWDEHVYSAESYAGGAYVAARVAKALGQYMMLALNSDPASDASFAGLDFAIYCNLGQMEIYESNTGYTVGTCTDGDQFMITYDGVVVRYYKNGDVLRERAIGAGFRFYLDSSFNNQGAGFDDIAFGPFGLSSSTRTAGTGRRAEGLFANPYLDEVNAISGKADGLLVFNDGIGMAQQLLDWQGGVPGSSALIKASGGDTRIITRAWRCKPSTRYRARVIVQPENNVAVSGGFYVRPYEYDFDISAPVTHIGPNAYSDPVTGASMIGNNRELSRQVENVGVIGAAQTFVITWTSSATAKWTSLELIKYVYSQWPATVGMLIHEIVIEELQGAGVSDAGRLLDGTYLSTSANSGITNAMSTDPLSSTTSSINVGAHTRFWITASQ
jgi:hypothetical protein